MIMMSRLYTFMPMQEVLNITNLTKRYGKIWAVKNLNLKVAKGQVLGLLGPNGSGKSTTLSVILDVIKATEGTYQWFGGIPEVEARKRIGALLEKPVFYPYLSAVKNLQITAKIKGKGDNRIDEVLQLVGLYDRKNSMVKSYSFGMKQRLSIASTLIADPEVLILDEPTNGLDPRGIVDIRQLIVKVARSGKTIILASHLLDEVEKICTHVAVLKKGELIELRKLIESENETRKIFELRARDFEKMYDVLQGMDEVKIVNSLFDGIVLESGLSGEEINKRLADNGVYLSHLQERRKSLEEDFLEITKE